jgi:hypothetical protein
LSVSTAVPATERLSRARFAVADELTCYYDRPDEPWYYSGPQVDFCRVLAASPVPVAVKDRLLRTAITLAGSVVCDTCLVSNLGVIEPVTFGAVTASQLWFSTFAHMPRGLSLGALTVAGQLRLTFRFRPALFSEPAAAVFASRYVQVLDRITGPEVKS